MRPVQLEPVPIEPKSRLAWCVKMIENIARASQINSPVATDKKNSGTFLKVASNLGDVADKAAAFTAIKQNATEEVTGVIALATVEETLEGENATKGTHPAGVKAAIDALVESVTEALEAFLVAADNLSDVADAATAFSNIKQAATTDETGVVEKAETSEVAAAQADKYIAADHLESASAPVALVDAATIAIDWKAAAANYSLTVAGNRQIGNPANAIPGQWRTIIVQGSNSTERTITFGNQFGGEVPEIGDCTSTKWYEIIIRCISTTHFVASARDVSPPA